MTNYIWGLLAESLPTFQAAAGGGASGGLDVWSLVWHSGLVVQFVLFTLILFSVLTWAVIISKYRVIRAAQGQDQEFQEVFWHAGSLSAAYGQTKHLEMSPQAVVFRLGYGELGKVMRAQAGEGGDTSLVATGVIENLQRSLNRGMAAESTRLGKAVTFLATCANTAPFIGLFGTVWGIMDSFRSVGATGTANLATVAPGIAEALVATATGLFAAIPAVVFYNHFNRRIQVLEAEMASFTQDFLNLVERDLMRRQGPAPAAETAHPGQAGRQGS
ncbi:MAG: protein TolQ [Desulfarculus sp.]|nr:protein TolQ [Desulfarculus sp.]